MKKLLAIIFTIALLFTACDKQDSLVSPEKSVVEAIQKQSFIELPAPANPSLNKMTKTGGYIANNIGGYLYTKSEYVADNGNYVAMKAIIQFPSEFMFDTKDASVFITMIVDDATASTQFYPEMIFKNFPSFSITYYGLDLSNINPEDIEFKYIANDGSIEDVKYDSFTVNIELGMLSVRNAKLPHFSRFGFLN